MIRRYKPKVINYEFLLKEARGRGVSVYLLEKRELNYRNVNAENEESCQNCCTCTASKKVKYVMDSESRIQCLWLGIFDDPFADVDSNHICNFYERGYEKNLTIKKGDKENETNEEKATNRS